MTEVLMKTWKGAKFCNQACVERRSSNAVRKREKMRNAHISEMRSKVELIFEWKQSKSINLSFLLFLKGYLIKEIEKKFSVFL